MTTASASFRLASASVVYGGLTALSAVDLMVEPGEAVALVGPSGAGKTTLLRLLNGTCRASDGRVEVDGGELRLLDGKGMRLLRSQVGFIAQDLALVPNLRVVQNVIAGRLGRMSLLRSVRAMTWPSRDDLHEVLAILERVGIADKLYERTDTLSGGERQRVAIARALFQEPRALLADEPVSSVDPERARATIDLLLALRRERGLTLVVSLHDIELAMASFPRLVGLRDGRVVFDASPPEIDGRQLEKLYALIGADVVAAGG